MNNKIYNYLEKTFSDQSIAFVELDKVSKDLEITSYKVKKGIENFKKFTLNQINPPRGPYIITRTKKFDQYDLISYIFHLSAAVSPTKGEKGGNISIEQSWDENNNKIIKLMLKFEKPRYPFYISVKIIESYVESSSLELKIGSEIQMNANDAESQYVFKGWDSNTFEFTKRIIEEKLNKWLIKRKNFRVYDAAEFDREIIKMKFLEEKDYTPQLNELIKDFKRKFLEKKDFTSQLNELIKDSSEKIYLTTTSLIKFDIFNNLLNKKLKNPEIDIRILIYVSPVIKVQKLGDLIKKLSEAGIKVKPRSFDSNHISLISELGELRGRLNITAPNATTLDDINNSNITSNLDLTFFEKDFFKIKRDILLFERMWEEK